MEDKLRLNTKLYGFDGIIARRDFFLNLVLISSITLFFTFPYFFWLLSQMQSASNWFHLNKIFIEAPTFLKLWLLIGIIGFYIFTASNIFRRLNDINGKVNIYANSITTFILFISNLYYILPLKIIFLFIIIGAVLKIGLIFKKGKITKNYPYDFTKEFNWGAFIGTWIWGLVNKSYKTLWILLIGFTPWGPLYQLYCGLKGNEWAYKNKKYNDVTEFRKSQKGQSIIFAILPFAIAPVIYSIIIILATFNFIFTATSDIKNNPQKAEQTATKLENIIDNTGSIYFETYQITKEENKFYVLSSDWKYYSFEDKRNIIDLAANISSMKRNKEYKKQNPNGYEYFSKSSELPRTKIYSAETKQLLGEFVLDENILKSDSLNFGNILKASLTAYRFYNVKKEVIK